MNRADLPRHVAAMALAAGWLSCAALAAQAQDSETSALLATPNTWRIPAGGVRPGAVLDVAAWLRGQYVGTGLGGEVELQFMPPRGGAMIGSFRLLRGERTEFFEQLQMVEADGSLQLRVKHFTPEFVGWEEKDKYLTFRFVEARDNDLRFEGLTYRRTDDGLQIFIAMRSHGELREHVLTLRRLP